MKKILIAFAILIFLIMMPFLLSENGFFIVSKPVISNKLIVEGWLSPNALEEPPFHYKDYDTIFVVGTKSPSNWNKISEIRNDFKSDKQVSKLRLPTNGFVFFRKYREKGIKDSITTIQVIEKGTKARGKFPHFFISVKDSIIAHSFATAEKDTLTFHVKVDTEDLDYLNLYFDNDMMTDSEDINLEIYEILLNKYSFLPSNDEIFYIKSYDYEFFNSNAVKTSNYLRTIVGNKTKIITIDTLYRNRNKTLAAARSFAKYLKVQKINISSINIYTLDFHSRRTGLSYRKALGPAVQIGSIIRDCSECTSPKEKRLRSRYYRALDEFISWFITLIS